MGFMGLGFWTSLSLSFSSLQIEDPKGIWALFLSSSWGFFKSESPRPLIQTVPLSMENLRNFWVWTRGANGAVANGVFARVLLVFFDTMYHSL
jgi:hypothetical protein